MATYPVCFITLVLVPPAPIKSPALYNYCNTCIFGYCILLANKFMCVGVCVHVYTLEGSIPYHYVIGLIIRT